MQGIPLVGGGRMRVTKNSFDRWWADEGYGLSVKKAERLAELARS
jgi:hypothetical protein